MRLSTILIILCVLLTAILYDSLPGQDRSTKTTNSQLPARISDQTYRISVDLVNVFCSVFDKNTNSFVTTLTEHDFSIFEDGQKQEIKNFVRETNLPLTVAMLVDTSESVGPKLKFEQEAAIAFFQNILRMRCIYPHL